MVIPVLLRTFCRITSYNVCYTKLLRAASWVLPAAFKGAKDAKFAMYVSIASMWGGRIVLGYIFGIHFVITSYSIHYTKLYDNLRVETAIKDAAGHVVASGSAQTLFGDEFEQNIALNDPQLWSPESPVLYYAESKLYDENGQLQDEQTTRFGVRMISYKAGA